MKALALSSKNKEHRLKRYERQVKNLALQYGLSNINKFINSINLKASISDNIFCSY